MFCRASMTLRVLVLIVLAMGCGRVHTFVPVEGTITKDGQPLFGVQVMFYPDPDAGAKGPRSVGKTDEAGHYRLQTDHGESGVVAGKHRVCIVDPPFREGRLQRRASHRDSPVSSNPNGMLKEMERRSSRVPAIYGQISKTPLQVDVRPGSVQAFDFNLP